MSQPRTLDLRIAELGKSIEQKRAQMAQLKARQASSSHTADTRRKILAGAAALNLTETDPDFATRFARLLDDYLTADRDRRLFGLPPRQGSKEQKEHVPDKRRDDTQQVEERQTNP